MSDEGQRLSFVGTSDLAGLIRGKSFPEGEWAKRTRRGIGWTPTNVQITCFDAIAETPFGSLGDLVLVPDETTRFRLGGARPLDFSLGDIRSLEGEPWDFCTRSLARKALNQLHEVAGAHVVAAYEHEFQLRDVPARRGDSYGFKGFRDAQAWAEPLMDALTAAGIVPDSFMKEYGPGQYEVVMKPAQGLAAADNAALLRLLTHDVLGGLGLKPTFAPILDPDSVGNGLHVHMSFVDDGGTPLTHDATDPHGLSPLTRHFIGGVLTYLDQILALLAPSEISYLRLTPHRWSAAFNNLGYRDREASVRICPVTAQDPEGIAKQFNFELRAADCAASPFLTMAAMVFAGVQGIRDRIDPPAPTQEDLSLLTPEALEAKGFRRLPTSLDEALKRFSGSAMVRQWFGDGFVDLYTAHKRGEMAAIADLDWRAKCDRYAEVY
ncbi:type I glutamate--ammonia ligase [Chachezhania sediminis]|uniref:glutamine synthetase family protein n=1 Tax=Chachezhania sediminis TaxID=2599291 RepID=UPI00131D4DE0|nr:glutamine synthetase family protein [Chachezhania sediminis]